MCHLCKRRAAKKLRKKLKRMNRVLEYQGEQILTDLSRLTQEVSENTTVIGSAIALLRGLADQIRELSTDPAALNALADQLNQNEQDLAAEVAANTPIVETEEPPLEEAPS